MTRRPRIAIGIVALLVVHGASLPAASTPRVALLQFKSEDNSYLSQRAAADFSTALQGLVSGLTGVEWVERTELEKAGRESGLAALGFVQPIAAVPPGQWSKADVAVSGRFFRDEAKRIHLALEVIDLRHGELLAEEVIDF